MTTLEMAKDLPDSLRASPKKVKKRRPGCKTGAIVGVNGGLLYAALARGDKYYLATCEHHGQSVFYVWKTKATSCGRVGACYACNRENVWRRQGFAFTWVDYDAMLRLQLGRCAICRGAEPLDVDHCHHKGHVRGLLCSLCNNGIGRLRDDPALLRKAANYLEAS